MRPRGVAQVGDPQFLLLVALPHGPELVRHLPVELRRVGGGLLVTPQRQHAHPALNPVPGAFGHGLLGGPELVVDSTAQFPLPWAHSEPWTTITS